MSSTHQDSANARLASIATRRERPLFDADLGVAHDRVRAAIEGKRVLAIGAAGSIGSATVQVMLAHGPACLHIVDQNENDLAELVRTLQSRPGGIPVADFRTLPVDYGSPALRLLLNTDGGYDIVLNFAAIKHVRSEKDVFSMMQMFDTNIRKQAQLMSWLVEAGFAGRFFSVSTDKAANPSSFMGATKRMMEHVMFSGEAAAGFKATVTSARFANVAFSNGSLLQSFQKRLEQRQPLAAPGDTRRYFVSLEEAGQLCTIAATCGQHGQILVPRLDPADHLVPLEEIAERFLREMGLGAHRVQTEDEARASVEVLSAEGKWPLLVTSLDTAGEKPYEEFVADGEAVSEIGMPNLLAVTYKRADEGLVGAFLGDLISFFEQARVSAEPAQPDKDMFKRMLASVEPAFMDTHKASQKSLDTRL